MAGKYTLTNNPFQIFPVMIDKLRVCLREDLTIYIRKVEWGSLFFNRLLVLNRAHSGGGDIVAGFPFVLE